MKKTLITAAAIALTTSVAGIAYAASPGATPSSDDRSVVVPAATTDDPTGDRGRGRDHAEDDVTPTTLPTLEHPAGDDRGIDAPATHDVGDDHGGLAGGAGGADDPAGHDANDDRGGSGSGSGSGSGRGGDDPAGHDVGDDHGSGGHGADG